MTLPKVENSFVSSLIIYSNVFLFRFETPKSSFFPAALSHIGRQFMDHLLRLLSKNPIDFYSVLDNAFLSILYFTSSISNVVLITYLPQNQIDNKKHKLDKILQLLACSSCRFEQPIINRMRKHLQQACYVLLFLSISIFSCRKDKPVPNALKSAIKNFQYAVNGANVKIMWDTPDETFDHYEMQLSKNEDFSVLDQTKELIKSTTEHIYYKLSPAEILFTRIRMVSKKSNSASDWAVLKFSTDQNNLLYPINDADVSGNSVTLKWQMPSDEQPNASKNLTKISLKPIIGETQEYTLTAKNIVDKSIEIRGIQKDMKYSVNLYDGTFIRGSQEFTTLPEPVNGLWILNPYSNLKATLENSKNGDKISLKFGTYDLSNTIIAITNKSITIQTAETNPNKKPKLYARGFEMNGSSFSMSFIGLDISGARLNEFKEELPDLPDHAWNNRLLTLNGTATGFDAVIFKDCTIRNYVSGIFNASDNNRPPHKTGNLLSVDNCIIYETGKNEEGCLMELNAAELKNASFTNSTFYKANKMLIRIDAEKNPANNIINFLFKNNTVDNCWTAGAFDFKALKAPASVTIENSIFSNIICINNFLTNFAFTANTFQKKLINTDFYKVTSKATVYGSNLSNMPVSSWELRHPNTIWNEVHPSFIRNDANHANPNSIKEYPVSIDPGYLNASKVDFKVSSASALRTLDNGRPVGDPRWW